MKRFFTLLTITLLWAVTAEAAIEPLRISITTNAISVAAGATATIDILQSSGAPFTTAQTTTIPITTDAGGVSSFVVTTADFTGTPTYAPDNLVRVTFDEDGTGSAHLPVVISIERMEVMYAKQGLFGTTIDPDEINQTVTYTFHDISVGSSIPGTIEAYDLIMKDAQTTPNKITLQAPASVTDSYTLTFPQAVGLAGQTLVTDASGVLSWGAPSTDWHTIGNTVSDGDFLGTLNDKPLIFKVYNQKAGEVSTGTNTSFGYLTLSSESLTGTANTAIGYLSLSGNLGGYHNTSIGVQAMQTNTSGFANCALGNAALYQNTTGNYNVAIGQYALMNNQAKSNSTAIGWGAMMNADNTETVSDANNTAVGYEVLKGSSIPANNTGTQNTAVGSYAMWSNTTGTMNTANGYQSLYANTTGNGNAANGYQALFANTTGLANTAIGAFSLRTNKANNRTTAIGTYAMSNADNRTTGRETYNTAVGYQALYGSGAAANNTGQYNTAIGDQAMLSNTDGSNNTAIGSSSLLANTSGYDNIALGYTALQANTEGFRNVAIGNQALSANTSGDFNSAIGFQAGYKDGASADNLTGANSLFLGAGTKPLADAQTNQIVIGFGAIGAGSNSVTLGNASITTTVLRGNVTGGTFNGLTITNNGSTGLNIANSKTLTVTDNASVSGTNTGDQTLSGLGGVAANSAITAATKTKITYDAKGLVTVGADLEAADIPAIAISKTTGLQDALDLKAPLASPTFTGTVKISDGSSNTIGILAPSISADYTLTLPTVAPAVNQVLTNDGTTVGTMIWTTPTTDWHTTGNTIDDGDYLGTKNNKPLIFLVNNEKSGEISSGANTSFGYQTLLSTTGTWNTAIGYQVLSANTTGSRNTAIGNYALINNETGSSNIAIGDNSMRSSKTTNNNIGIGSDVLNLLDGGGGHNIGIGWSALKNNTIGPDNVAIGSGALASIDEGYSITALGRGAGQLIGDGSTANTKADYSLFLGAWTKPLNINQTNQIVIGYDATGYGTNSVTLGNTDIATTVLRGTVRFADPTTPFTAYVGIKSPSGPATYTLTLPGAAPTVSGQVLSSTTAGVMSWVAAGSGSGWTLTGNSISSGEFLGTTNNQPLIFKVNGNKAGEISTSSNTGYGYQSLYSGPSGTNNTALGFHALYANTSGSANTAVGNDVMPQNQSGAQNTAVGENALYTVVSGSNNVAVGYHTLYANTASYNTAIGNDALPSNSSGNYNTALGHYSLYGITSGSNNTGLGSEAGHFISGGSTANQTSSTSVYIGANTKASANGNSNEIVIGYDATGTGTNSVTLGNEFIATTVLHGNVTGGTFNGLTITNNGSNVLNIANAKTLTVTDNASVSGTNTGDQTLSGLGGVPTTRTVNGHALSTDITVTATDVSLGNVTNESKATMFTSPTFTGTVKVSDGSSNTIGVLAPSISADYTLTLPTDDGTSNQVLSTDGSGNLSWVTPGTGFVWTLTGNSISSGEFLGTTNNQPLIFKVNGNKAGEISTSSNTGYGYQSLYSGPSGTNNTALGFHALYANTSGSANTAVGNDVMPQNQSGAQNTAVGENALYTVVSGSNNVAVGYHTLYANTASYNTAIGNDALPSNSSGNYNTALGHYSLYGITSGSNNTGLGSEAGHFISGGSTANQTSSTSVYIGANTKASANGNSNEIVIGYDATGAGSNTVTLGNASITTTVLRGDVTAGTYNGFTLPSSNASAAGQILTATGTNKTLQWVTPNAGWDLTGNSISAGAFLGTTNNQPLIFKVYGNKAGEISTSSNTGYGYQSLNAGPSGTNNTAIGFHALFANSSGSANTAVGNDVMPQNQSGAQNTAVGENALYTNSSGSNNVAIGYHTLYANTSSYNTAVGNDALPSNSSGNYNTALGHYSLYGITSGSNNIGLGSEAGHFISDGSTANQTGANSVYLGANTKSSANGNSNEIVIGYDATGAGSNTATLGNASITTTVLRGNVTIGTCLSLTPQASAPSSPTTGTIYYDSTSNTLKCWNGTEWKTISFAP